MSRDCFAGGALPAVTNAFFFSITLLLRGSHWCPRVLGRRMNSASGESSTPFLMSPASQKGPSGRCWGLATLSGLQHDPSRTRGSPVSCSARFQPCLSLPRGASDLAPTPPRRLLAPCRWARAGRWLSQGPSASPPPSKKGPCAAERFPSALPKVMALPGRFGLSFALLGCRP